MREVLCVVLIWIIAVEMVMFSRAIPYQMAEASWRQKQAEELEMLSARFADSANVDPQDFAAFATSE
jgi:hypothetical protein